MALQDGRLSVTDPAGRQHALDLARLSRVLVEAEASGPLGADCWWQFFDAEGRLALRYPQGAAGESGVIDWLLALPGFDHGGMLAAMGATRPGVFAVWDRDGSG
ncbi:hypothetical protein BKE38_15665 [Pseudoroseomonas deserti]|uniref:Uncharacterized protein n=1 Tax=Teichococcus deserti TaxID=1817963 RepID=A0A1V2H0X2_9PROT|nr:hypothetical protein BKE38_15665 [Pseudoroseomonas deserti]